MHKIEYKIKVEGKVVKKTAELKELSWADYCKTVDISFLVANPNGAIFTNCSKYVQVHLGKTEDQMKAWRNGYANFGEFESEIFILAKEIGNYIGSKKK